MSWSRYVEGIWNVAIQQVAATEGRYHDVPKAAIRSNMLADLVRHDQSSKQTSS